MLATTIDTLNIPPLWYPVVQQIRAAAEQAIPVPSSQLALEIRPSYVLGNTGMTIRVCAVLTGDHVVDNYLPRTELGRKLLALRRAYVTTGGHLLDGNALDAEVQLRRGGVVDA